MPNSSIGRYLVGLAAILLLEKLSQPKAGSDSSEKRAPKREVEQPFGRSPLVVGIANEGPNAEEQQHREDEKEYWRKTGKYAFWTVVISGCALGAASAAFWETRRQAEAAAEGNRAWIYIEQMDINSIAVSDKGSIEGSFNFYINNLGHSVSTRAYVAVAFQYPEPMHFYKPKEYCDRIHISDFEGPGRVVFPNKLAFVGAGTNPFTFERGHLKLLGIQIAACAVYELTTGETRKTGILYHLDDIDTSHARVITDIKAVPDLFAGSYAD